MTNDERQRLMQSKAQYVSYGYFCGEDKDKIVRLKVVNEKNIPQ